MEILNVKEKYEKKIFKKLNVVGVMTGYKITENKKTDELSILCLVEKKTAKEELKKKELIPIKIKGFSTDVIEVGKIIALSTPIKEVTDRYRPCPMGTSGGHFKISAGTNGELLKDKRTGKICIGTNNHVGANSNNASIGDPYLQPGSHDDGELPKDQIGTLLRFVRISFKGEGGGNGGDGGNGGGGPPPSPCPNARIWTGLYNVPARLLKRKTRLRAVLEVLEYDNEVDAALIEVKQADVESRILNIGVPKGIKTAELDMLVQKSGRTTGHTTQGEITGIDASLDVNYGAGKIAHFINQIVISKTGFSSGGDSGSLVLDMNVYAIGKLFAGSSNTTIANPIQSYLSKLNAELITT